MKDWVNRNQCRIGVSQDNSYRGSSTRAKADANYARIFEVLRWDNGGFITHAQAIQAAERQFPELRGNVRQLVASFLRRHGTAQAGGMWKRTNLTNT